MSDQTGGGGGGQPPNINVAGGHSVRLHPASTTNAANSGANVVTTRGQQQYVYTSQAGLAGHTQGGTTRILNMASSPRVAVSTAGRVNGPSDASAATTSATSHPTLVNSLSTPPRANVCARTPPSMPSPPRKRAKLDSAHEDRGAVAQSALKDKRAKMRAKCEHYAEVTAECFFLQADGNMMDYHTWRKRAPTAPFLHFLRTHRLDPKDDDEDLTLLLSLSCHAATASPHPDILVDGGRATPIALSTTLPPAVAQLNQIGGTPLVPESLSSAGSRLAGAGSQRKGVAPAAPTTALAARLQLRSPNESAAGSGTQEQMAEKAKHEASVMQRVTQLQREGLWAEKRLPKLQEPARAKAHWDYLVEEMVWLAADFAQERKWKKAAAKKCARNVQKYFQEKVVQAKKEEKLQELQLKRTASLMAREIKTFWANAEKIVEHKQKTRLEEKRKQALDQHLSFIVDQTEKYSTWLAESMNKTTGTLAGPGDSVANTSMPVSLASSRISSPSRSDGIADDEFLPALSSTDDEETIAKAEEDMGIVDNAAAEIEMLKRESELPIEDLLKRLREAPEELGGADSRPSGSSSPPKERSKDAASKDGASKDGSDFRGSDRDVTDDEDTIMEQEKAEGKVDHKRELADLEAESHMSIDELMAKYGGTPAPDYAADGDSERDSERDSDRDSGRDSEQDEGSEDLDSSEDDLSTEEEEDQEEVGLESLLDDGTVGKSATDNEAAGKEINDVAALAESIQPKGNTLSSTNVATPIPFLLKHSLREYQHIGLDWLVTMFDRKLNGILADEMGLGKTIQTISLLAHLACEKGNWGPHLIIVPTSVMLNWEMELKKWCPAFKILTYYGTQKERKLKRTGWTKPNAFHICITSYKLVIQDHQSFRRKKWKYLILDEAQNIKNFKSQRWQLLLNFQTQRRLLLTGTPLQNNLMELWSLMHFLMPNVFQSHREFKEWFSNPVTGMIEGNSEYNETIIKRLHKVLRPFLLRRLKCEVEKQLPKKYEHVIMCRLSKRQRYLYDDFMSRAKTRETLATGNLLSVINVLMQLRKVCNHPNLFEVRPTTSPFQMEGLTYHTASLVWSALDYDFRKHVSLGFLSLLLSELELCGLSAYAAHYARHAAAPRKLIEELDSAPPPAPPCPPGRLRFHVRDRSTPAVLEGLTKLGAAPGRHASPRGTALTLQVTGGTQLQGVSVQLVQHKGALKAIPVAGGQATSAPAMATGLTGFSVKQGDAAAMQTISMPAGFAHVVQTSSGRRILLTSSPHKQPASANNAAAATLGFALPGSQRLGALVKSPAQAGRGVGGSPTRPGARGAAPLPTGFINALISGAAANSAASGKTQTPTAKPTPAPLSRFHIAKLEEARSAARRNKLHRLRVINDVRCRGYPLYGADTRRFLSALPGDRAVRAGAFWTQTHALTGAVRSAQDYVQQLADVFAKFVVCVPAVSSPAPCLHVSHPAPSRWLACQRSQAQLRKHLSARSALLHPIASAMATQFPDPRLIQYDCGKLQVMDRLLRQLKVGHHRVLIFTQMTRMLDVLEAFLNFHGHIYLRLDGTTKVDQRQLLMERFNADKRIFCFILSTRSGGIGVNLTGADTVVFYDSDWNPTMDAQAQDRCHRIGQTRDVHIYRLVSEMTVEENILKKANQKRLLGDLAIEGGNFTTAYFKSSTIADLFQVAAGTDAAHRLSEVLDRAAPAPLAPAAEEKAALGALEVALAAAEDDSDVQAARTALAEASAELAEFDENIPLDEADAAGANETNAPEVSKAEQEVNNLIQMLSPVERYAMKFIENTESAWSAEQLAAAEAEIEQQKREWELGRVESARDETERRARLAADDELLTYSRHDARNQVWVSANAQEQMPMWCPPTPPRDDGDVYIDYPVFFAYERATMTESQLPPVYVKRERKRRAEAQPALERDGRRPNKVRHKEESFYAPKSLFDRPSPAVMKMRRDMKLQKFRGMIRPPLSLPGVKPPLPIKPFPEPDHVPEWIINEDWAILQTVQSTLGLPLNLMVISPGHTPNWDLVSEMVNNMSVIYRSAKQCRNRYEAVVVPREEGKVLYDANPKKLKKNKATVYKVQQQTKTSRPMRTSQLNLQDNNASRTRMLVARMESARSVASKRAPSVKPLLVNPTLNNPKHAAVLAECGIDYDTPANPPKVAQLRIERISKEKNMKVQAELQRMQQQSAQAAKPAGALAASAAPTSATAPGSAGLASMNPMQLGSAPAAQAAQTASAATPSAGALPQRPRATAGATLTMQEMAGGQQLRVAGGAPTMVSVASLSPAQMQLAAQRLVTGGLQPPVTVVTTKGGVGGIVTASKPLTVGQVQYLRQQQIVRQQRQIREQQLKLLQAGQQQQPIGQQPAGQQPITQQQQMAAGQSKIAVAVTTANALGVTTVQVSPAGPRTQYIKTTSGGKQITRAVTEVEMALLLKRQQQLKAAQQAQLLAQAGLSQTQPAALGQTQPATLVKAVAAPGGSGQSLQLPLGMKTATPQQIRQIQIQQQLMQQRKLSQQKGGALVSQVAGKGTQLLVQQKPTTMTYQLNQVIKQVTPQHLGHVTSGQPGMAQAASGGQMISHAVVARTSTGGQTLQARVIPVSAMQQPIKQSIQVVSAAGGGRAGVPNATVDAAGRPVVAMTTLASALAMKSGTSVTSAQHQAMISQVTAALQGQPLSVRANSVRGGPPLIAVTIQQQAQGAPPVVTAQQVVARPPPPSHPEPPAS